MKLTFYSLIQWPLLALLCSNRTPVQAEELRLPSPRTQGGMPLMEALSQRQSIREFSPQQLAPQQLSDLLWAAFGVNRPETNNRTAPSAMNAQEIDLYVATADGVFVYEPLAHVLKRIASEDIRERTGGQAYVKEAPIALLLVADYARMTRAKSEDKDFYAAIDAGYISQNIYLYCTSAKLATVVHELNRGPLVSLLKLRPDQRIIIAQSVGYAKE